MKLENVSLNQRLLDQQEQRFLESDLQNYAETLECPKLSKNESRASWLKKFVEGYNHWNGRLYRHNRYPLHSYFVIDGTHQNKA